MTRDPQRNFLKNVTDACWALRYWEVAPARAFDFLRFGHFSPLWRVPNLGPKRIKSLQEWWDKLDPALQKKILSGAGWFPGDPNFSQEWEYVLDLLAEDGMCSKEASERRARRVQQALADDARDGMPSSSPQWKKFHPGHLVYAQVSDADVVLTEDPVGYPIGVVMSDGTILHAADLVKIETGGETCFPSLDAIIDDAFSFWKS